MTDADIYALSQEVARACRQRQVLLVVAESCTGGGLAAAITRIPGSSAWFDRAFVTYSYEAKTQVLGVRRETLLRYGAVSEAVAGAMARGALRRSAAQVSVSITGIAGPGGGTPDKPVGLVWFAWAVRGGTVQARALRFQGDRDAIRRQAVGIALQGLADLLRTRA